MNGPASSTDKVISDHAALRALIGKSSKQVWEKDIGRIDEHVADFIALSPFMLLATSGADGSCDVSPRGEAPGGFRVLDGGTLAFADRPGNRRVDSLSNIIDNPQVGLLFCVPGKDETLRVNGDAQIVVDEELLAGFTVKGRTPTLAVRVTVRQAYFHCAKAFRRSDLWNPASWPDRSALPSLGRVAKDQRGGTIPASVIDAALAADAKFNLY